MMVPVTVFRSVEAAAGAVTKMDGVVEVLGQVTHISRVEDFIFLVQRDAKHFRLKLAHIDSPSGQRIAEMEAALLKTERLAA